MRLGLEFFGSVLLAGLVLWWVLARVVFPAVELLGVLRRISAGDYRPVILGGMPPFFRSAADHLRVAAETLARQKELLAREEFGLATILGSMTEGVVITSPDLRIRLMNKAAEAMFGLSGTVRGLLLAEVFLSHDLLAVARRASASGSPEHGELTLRLPGHGDRGHLLVTAAPLGKAGQDSSAGLLLVLHDVTRLRELESVRREFVANVSHEFRTPLSVISGYLETLEEEDLDPEMRRRALLAMRRHADRLGRLIEDLLTISRMEERKIRLETSPVDPVGLLRGVIEQQEREIGCRSVRIITVFAPDLPVVEADPHLIEQAFSNLLANALRHGASEEGEITVSAERNGAEIMVSFRDNGPGVPLKDQEHLFERFYRVGGDRARQTGGTGLGLSIVKHAVESHGGRVTLESKPGAGATFRIFLPVAGVSLSA